MIVTMPVIKAAGVVAVMYFLVRVVSAKPTAAAAPLASSGDVPTQTGGGSVIVEGGSCTDQAGNPAPCKQGSWGQDPDPLGLENDDALAAYVSGLIDEANQ